MNLNIHEYYVYILRCRDGSYYTGVTNDDERRLTEHGEGLDPSSYTHSRRPVKLVYLADFQDINEAISWEKKVKRWSRAKKEALIRREYERLPSLAKKKNFQRNSRQTSLDTPPCHPECPLSELREGKGCIEGRQGGTRDDK